MEQWYWLHAAHEIRAGLWASAIRVTWPAGKLEDRYIPDWGHHGTAADAREADVALALRFAAERHLPPRTKSD